LLYTKGAISCCVLCNENQGNRLAAKRRPLSIPRAPLVPTSTDPIESNHAAVPAHPEQERSAGRVAVSLPRQRLKNNGTEQQASSLLGSPTAAATAAAAAAAAAASAAVIDSEYDDDYDSDSAAKCDYRGYTRGVRTRQRGALRHAPPLSSCCWVLATTRQEGFPIPTAAASFCDP
jgi:hypothetical protein